jgi:hypothetical protein
MELMNIGYHTRLKSDNRVKVVGGSFGGSLDIETANRLVKALFTVKILKSGRAVFVDKQGREVSLYISVDPELTDEGKAALKAYRACVEQREKAENEKAQQLQDMLDSLSVDEAIERLKNL